MKKQLSFSAVMVGLAMVLLSMGAYAANDPAHDPTIVERIEKQQMRIDQGIKTGSLTKEEAALVQDNLNRIKADEAQLKAAGQLTDKEKASLMHKLDLNSTMMANEGNNSTRAAVDPMITERFAKQQTHIDEGVKNGSLTKEEAALVQDNLNRIKAEEAQLKAAGHLTDKTKESLMHKLDLNSTMIQKEKKNAIMRID